MPKWCLTLDIKDAFQQALNDEISSIQLAGVIADRLEKLNIPSAAKDMEVLLEMDQEELVDRFRYYFEDGIDDIHEFDGIMYDLYNWADTQLSGNFFDAVKLCWVKTNF